MQSSKPLACPSWVSREPPPLAGRSGNHPCRPPRMLWQLQRLGRPHRPRGPAHTEHEAAPPPSRRGLRGAGADSRTGSSTRTPMDHTHSGSCRVAQRSRCRRDLPLRTCRSLTSRTQFADDNGQYLVKIANEPQMGHFEDRRAGIFVDRDDKATPLHPHQVLDGP